MSLRVAALSPFPQVTALLAPRCCLMSGIPSLPEAAASQLAAVSGDASSAQELASCKIGGCCGRDTPLLPADVVAARLPFLPDWALSDDGKAISRSFVAKNWGAAMAFINAASEVCEDEGHHPDLHLTNWRDVRVVLSTHAVGGLTLPDLVLAAKLDTVEVEYSPKWLKQRQAQAAAAAGS